MRIAGIIIFIFAILNLIIGIVATSSGESDAAVSKFGAFFFLCVISAILLIIGNKKKKDADDDNNSDNNNIDEIS